jgi:hypothetical protein
MFTCARKHLTQPAWFLLSLQNTTFSQYKFSKTKFEKGQNGEVHDMKYLYYFLLYNTGLL